MIQNLFALLIVFSVVSCSTMTKQGKNPSVGEASSLSSLDLNLDVKKYTLENGLRLLVVENSRLPILSYYTFYDVGGRFESRERGTTGATHFLEHMMFKGAKKYGPGEIEKIIEGNGGNNNAYTTFDSTVYYESVPSSILDKIVDVEADRMQNLLLEEKSFESERLVVLEERKMRYENSPRGKLYQGMMKEVFRGTPYGGSVIGDEKDVKNLSREQMMEFFKTFYVPNNAIVVVVGDVKASRVHRLVKEKYGKLKKSLTLDAQKKEIEGTNSYKIKPRRKKEVRINGTAPNPIFMVSYPGEPLGTRKAFVMDLLSSMLGGGASSYLNQTYVERKKPLFSSISAANYNLKNSGLFFLAGSFVQGTSLSRLRKLVRKESKKFCSSKILTDRALQKTLNQYLVDYYGELETNSGVASFVGMRESFFGDFNYYKKELEIYSSISLDEIKTVCREIFVKSKPTIFHVWNKNPRKR